MTFDERVQALEPLGFNPVQTRFLVTVALHGGFCLRRHYMAFAGLQYGAGVRDFLDRLVTRRLARRFMFRPDRGHVYHLHASGLYTAIDQDDNRNRRRTSPSLIARKLMVLDYVLSDRGADWYATEQDKVALFTTRFSVPDYALPQRAYRPRRPPFGTATTRYFIHKLPIGLTSSASAVASFVFLVTDTSGHALRQFLDDHVSLFQHLPAWRLVAVAPPHVPGLPACEAVFRRFVAEGPPRLLPDDVPRLRTYFRVLACLERNDLAPATLAEIDTFRDTRPRFSAPRFEGLFRRWQLEGDAALAGLDAGSPRPALGGRGSLLTHRLPIHYDRFGARAGVS